MTTLLSSLRNSDAAILAEIARFWGVDSSRLGAQELPEVLHETMTEPQTAERIWDELDDAQRGVFQTLLGASGSKMTLSMFERLHGEIRKMGTAAIEREKPLENPTSSAEALYYRGLIYDGFENTPTGIRPIVFVPPELAASLPTHRTSYTNLTADESGGDFPGDEGTTIDTVNPDSLTGIHLADTTVVDDLITLLGYLQVRGGEVTADSDLDRTDRENLVPYLLNDDEARLTFLFKLATSANLIDIQGKQASLRRAEARRWLESQRPAQLEVLADTWRNTTHYRDLWQVPGLNPEPTGWSYNPLVGREALISFLREFAPKQAWWSPDEFINIIKETEPDFQRPGGDYDSWYIRDAGGEYLSGFESWDAVEGALLFFYLTGPMHWLGMVDVAQEAVRLTAYGRAFVGWGQWPSPQIPEERIGVQDNGTLLISRRVPGIDRFQAMRFSTWEEVQADSPYVYVLDAQGIRQAAEQGISTTHITTFLSRALGGAPIPPAVGRLLETWQSGPSASVTLERLIVLRTTSPETLDFIVNTPALRRYLGVQLGVMAVVVRADQWKELRSALGGHGIEVDTLDTEG